VFTAEILPIGVLDPSIDKRLVALVVDLFHQILPTIAPTVFRNRCSKQ
jgi:hypothetical protein